MTLARRGVLVGLALISALSLTFGAQELLPASASNGVRKTAGNTAVFDAQRVRWLASASQDDQAFDQRVREAVASTPLGDGTTGCLIVQAGGRTVTSIEATKPLIPASALKVLTAQAAVIILGPTTRFDTTVKGTLDRSRGVVNGALTLVGGGDPLLVTRDYNDSLEFGLKSSTSIEALADGIVGAGVRSIPGGIAIDDSVIDHAREVAGWEPGYVQSGQVGRIGGLMVNDGFARYATGRVPADDPGLFAGGILVNLLRERGVVVGGGVTRSVTGPTMPTLASVSSPTVEELVGEMLTNSDNSTAEVLTKLMGRRMSGEGTTAAGTRAIDDVLRRHGVRMTDVVLADGSGLHRANRVTCQALLDTMTIGGPTGLVAKGFARAGESGTLTHRMTDMSGGKVIAKTGTLASTSSLVGYALPTSSSPRAFVMMENATNSEQSRQRQDALAQLIAQR